MTCVEGKFDIRLFTLDLQAIQLLTQRKRHSITRTRLFYLVISQATIRWDLRSNLQFKMRFTQRLRRNQGPTYEKNAIFLNFGRTLSSQFGGGSSIPLVVRQNYIRLRTKCGNLKLFFDIKILSFLVSPFSVKCKRTFTPKSVSKKCFLKVKIITPLYLFLLFVPT